MQLILLEKVANLGNLGDKVNVKAGYGRNFLLPQGKATAASMPTITTTIINSTMVKPLCNFILPPEFFT